MIFLQNAKFLNQNNAMYQKKLYLCTMFKKLSCLAIVFALALLSWAEDLQSVMSYYKPDMSNGFIFVSKVDMTLTLVSHEGKAVITYPMACGRNRGQKTKRGDYRTPEGHFLLQDIQDASTWGHDFHDGKGYIKNAYGPWFMRLQTGFSGIGIHGTHAPKSIGTRATEGCIRLDNRDVAELKKQVKRGMPVIIGPEDGVASLIAANIPSPAKAGANGRTSSRRPVKSQPSTSQPAASQPAQTLAQTDAVPEVEPSRPVATPQAVIVSPVQFQPVAEQLVSALEDRDAETVAYSLEVTEVVEPDGRVRYVARYVNK